MTEQKHRVLVCEPLGEEGLLILKSQSNFEVDVALQLKSEELKERIPHYHALLVRSQTQVNSDIINAGRNLKLIGRAGVGIDNIDIGCAEKNGIAVINTPSGNSISTAEFAFALLLCLARNIPFAHTHVGGGQWQRSKFLGQELSNKTLGLIGFGNVGKQMALRARAFNMNVVVFDPLLDESVFRENGVIKQNKE
ncbi:MAG TPA: NAD(P)-dependent oxidoreductase, partial [Myxococcota bacterium]|nr:NAD(P)-dependent oxidoreductase [Myxococcota bacterium]